MVLVTDSSGTSDGVSAPLVFTKYKAKNELYYDPDGVAMSLKEMQQRVQGPPKETVSRNTRFVMSEEVRRSQAEAASTAAAAGPSGDDDRVGNKDARVALEMTAGITGHGTGPGGGDGGAVGSARGGSGWWRLPPRRRELTTHRS